MNYKVQIPALGPQGIGDEVTLNYNSRFRMGTIEKLNRTHMVVHTREGYRSFSYGKIKDMRIVELAYSRRNRRRSEG